MAEVYLIAGMALVTFIIRYTLFAFAGRVEFPAHLMRALQYVPPAVLAAITIPAILIPTGDGISMSYTNPYLIGGLLAFGVGWFSRNLLLTIVIGMLAFLSWQWALTAWP